MILHLAAGANVDRSIERPLDFVMDNTVASVNLMEFARKHHPQLDRWVWSDVTPTYCYSCLDQVCLPVHSRGVWPRTQWRDSQGVRQI